MDIFSELMVQLEMNYYSRLILLIIELTALVIGIKKFETLDTAKYFFWYIAFDLTLFITSITIDTIKLIPAIQINSLNDIINLCVSLAEVGIYLYYFKKEIPIKNISKFITPILTTVSIYFFSKIILNKISVNFSLEAISHFLSSISFLLIFPFALISLLHLIKEDAVNKIYITPRFWITIGILYYSAISIPFYFFRGFFDIGLNLKILLDTVLFYTPFTLNITCILIAFVCKKPAKN